jgi:hypothetical protein
MVEWETFVNEIKKNVKFPDAAEKMLRYVLGISYQK